MLSAYDALSSPITSSHCSTGKCDELQYIQYVKCEQCGCVTLLHVNLYALYTPFTLLPEVCTHSLPLLDVKGLDWFEGTLEEGQGETGLDNLKVTLPFVSS